MVKTRQLLSCLNPAFFRYTDIRCRESHKGIVVNRIAYQGTQGAYSHLSCAKVYPDWQAIPCEDFQTAMRLVEQGQAELAMIPVENSTAGRVEEIYRLLPKMDLQIVAEHFEPVNHCLLAMPGTRIEDLQTVSSHPQALAQCLNSIEALGIKPIAAVDTALAAENLITHQHKKQAAIASSLAADLYGLDILRENFQDVSGNTTRFIVLAKHAELPVYEASQHYLTSVLFSVRNIPAALYKALGGFATNGINLIKLESYMDGGTMAASHFHIDIDGHPDQTAMRNALEELSFFASKVRSIGTYPAHEFRQQRAFV